MTLAGAVVELAALAVRALAARWFHGGALAVAGPGDEALAAEHEAAWRAFAAATPRLLERARAEAPGLFADLTSDEALLLALAAAADLDGEIGRAYGRLLGRGGHASADAALLLDLAARDRELRLALQVHLDADAERPALPPPAGAHVPLAPLRGGAEAGSSPAAPEATGAAAGSSSAARAATEVAAGSSSAARTSTGAAASVGAAPVATDGATTSSSAFAPTGAASVGALLALELLLIDGEGPLLGRSVRAAPTVVATLRGRRPSPAPVPRRAIFPASLLERARAGFAAALASRGALLLTGGPGSGRRTLAAVVADEHGLAVRCVELPVEGPAARLALARAARDARLAGALLVVELAHGGAPLDAPHLAPLLPRPLLLVAAPGVPPPPWAGPTRVLALADPAPPERLALWRALLDGTPAADEDVALVAERYQLRPAQIARAAARVNALEPEGAPPSAARLLAAARAELTHALGEIAERVETAGRWADVVLPDEVLARLRQIPVRLRQATRVFDEWGFGAHPGAARGIAVLFAGPPGTGKTLCASVIAGELGLELYRIDLSRVVSKWVGETEKNLSRVFDEAEGARAVILFDEADALFGKRTDVKSSSDRYANMEVNYLLQRIETYDGVAILTTNFAQSVDEAFRRRLQFRVEFPFPDADARVELWRKHLPPRALDPDVDIGDLADRFEFSGGNIRNAALAAAFAAAEADTRITHALLVESARLELEELGKLVAR